MLWISSPSSLSVTDRAEPMGRAITRSSPVVYPFRNPFRQMTQRENRGPLYFPLAETHAASLSKTAGPPHFARLETAGSMWKLRPKADPPDTTASPVLHFNLFLILCRFQQPPHGLRFFDFADRIRTRRREAYGFFLF